MKITRPTVISIDATGAPLVCKAGVLQNYQVRPGVVVHADGNRYNTPQEKLTFLRDCLANGIRSGNLKPITTDNQRRDLLKRIEQAEQQIAGAK